MKTCLYLVLFLTIITPSLCHAQVETNQKQSISLKYKGNIEGGYTVGVGDYDINRTDISTSHGILMYGYLFSGIGVGWNYYHKSETSYVPLFIDIRTDLVETSKDIIPLIGIKGGYSFNASDNFEKIGAFINPFLGVKYKTNDRYYIYLLAGYTAQWVNMTKYVENINMSGITFKIGFGF